MNYRQDCKFQAFEEGCQNGCMKGLINNFEFKFEFELTPVKVVKLTHIYWHD